METSFPSMTPMTGKRTIGNKAVIPSGTTSVTHHKAIHIAVAKVYVTAGCSGSRSNPIEMVTKRIGPEAKRIRLARTPVSLLNSHF